MDDGGPAFPTTDYEADGHRSPYLSSTGMSLRDWFAGMAMMGYLTDTKNPDNASPDKVAEWSYQNADSMLDARKVQP